MFELTNNSQNPIHFRRPDLRLNFDLLPGQSYTVTSRQAYALDLFIRDMDITVTPSSAKEPSPETQSTEIDKEAAVRGVALSGVIHFNSESRRPENANDFFNAGTDAEPKTDEAKAAKVEEEMKKAAISKAKAEDLKSKIKDKDVLKELDDNAEKVEKDAKKAQKSAPKTGEVDLGEIIPMAGGPEKDTTKQKSEEEVDAAKQASPATKDKK